MLPLFRRLLAPAALLVAAPFAASAASPTIFKLNEPPGKHESIAANVPSESADGRHLAYLTEFLKLNPFHVDLRLVVTDRRGVGHRIVSPAVSGDGNGVLFHQFTDDSRHLLFTMHRTSFKRTELYSYDVETGAIVRLDPELTDDLSIYSIRVSPDGESVLYTTQATDYTNELYIVPIAGGAARRLTGNTPAGQYVSDSDFTPDGKAVVFAANLNGSKRSHVYAWDVATRERRRISGTHPFYWERVTISPDSRYVVYTSPAAIRGNVDLYRASLEGGEPLRLTPEMTEVSGLDVQNYALRKISPDSQFVVYRGDHDVAGKFEYFAVPLAGGTPFRISEPRTESVRRNSLQIVTITQDNIVLFTNDTDPPEYLYRLFAASLTDRTTWRVSGNHGGSAFGFADLSPDGKTVTYNASESDDPFAPVNLYSVPITGVEPVQLTPHLPDHRTVGYSRFSPDGRWIVYHSDQDVDDVFELFRIPSTGGTPQRLNMPVTVTVGASRGYGGWTISRDSRSVYFNAETNVPDQRDLYSAVLPVEVPMDVQPAHCPNQLDDVTSGSVAVAIPGSDRIDLADVERKSITINGVPASNVRLADVATPVGPTYGKTDPLLCGAGGDGVQDLRMVVDRAALAATLGSGSSSQLVELRANLKSGGTIIAEDFVSVGSN